MAIEGKIPSVGESITSGVVSAWHKKSGEFVNEGEALFTLETDKVSTEIVAEKTGVLETKVPEGQEVKIGQLVAIIDDSKSVPEEKSPAAPKEKESEAKKKPAEERREKGEEKPLSPAVRRIVEEEHLEPERIPATGKGDRLTKGDVLAAAGAAGRASVREVATPKTFGADSFPATAAP